MLEHPAYSPDLAPSDFFLFPKIKEILKGRHFDDTENIRSNTTAALKAIPQKQFQNFIQVFILRLERMMLCWLNAMIALRIESQAIVVSIKQN